MVISFMMQLKYILFKLNWFCDLFYIVPHLQNNASGSSTKSSIAKKSKDSQEDSRAATIRQPFSGSILNVSDGADKRDAYEPPIKISQTQATIISQQHQVINENLFPNIDDEFSPALNTNPLPVAVSVFPSLPSPVSMPNTALVSDRQLLFEIRSEILKVKQLYTQLVDKLNEGNPAMHLNSVDILGYHVLQEL